MRGNITRRGKSSWRIKFDIGVDADGNRLIQYQTIVGPKKAAQETLARGLAEVADGRYVTPTKETVETYARHWLEHIAPVDRAPLTIERYRSLIEIHIIPGLGSIELQALDGVAIDQFYALRRQEGRRYGGGLSSVTLHAVHRLLAQILASAKKAKKITSSPIEDVQAAPTPKRKKIEVLNDVDLVTLLDRLRGHWLYLPTLLAVSTGLRRGEVLGLRWADMDLGAATLQVNQAVQVVRRKIVIVAPKTERSQRIINLPAGLLPELARHRKDQIALRLKLGLGKDPADLVFTTIEGKVMSPQALSSAFNRMVDGAGIKRTSFHGLRHLHVTRLLNDGVPIHAVSARAGHVRPSITLDLYAHLLGEEDERAAKHTDGMLKRLLK